MSFFDKVYDRLFGDANESPSVEEHHLLKRGDRYMHDFHLWSSGDRMETIRAQIRTSIVLKERDLPQEPYVYLLNAGTSNGIAIDFSSFFHASEFSFLLDYLAEDILRNFNYKKSNADVRIAEKEDQIITTERRYLKPKTNFETPIDQQFGNILMETQIVGNTPRQFKLQVNSYRDRNYHPPKPFEDLLNHLFEY